MGASEVDQVAGASAGEGVDRLGDVSHHAHVIAIAEPELKQPLLKRRYILILIHHKVPVLAPDGARDVFPLRKHAHREEQHVLKVDHPALSLGILIHRDQPGDRGEVVAGSSGPTSCGCRLHIVIGRDQ